MAALEKRFYALSRETHPDRFATAGADEVKRAVERMSLLNEAYRTLKSPSELRQYFLRLEGFEEPVAEKGAAKLPAELAESWFELQDAVMEEPELAHEKIADFERYLSFLREQGEREFAAVERDIDKTSGEKDSAAARGNLARLSDAIRSESYFKSLERDVERIKSRFAGGGSA
jgi:molecular chaperone HscB